MLSISDIDDQVRIARAIREAPAAGLELAPELARRVLRWEGRRMYLEHECSTAHAILEAPAGLELEPLARQLAEQVLALDGWRHVQEAAA